MHRVLEKLELTSFGNLSVNINININVIHETVGPNNKIYAKKVALCKAKMTNVEHY